MEPRKGAAHTVGEALETTAQPKTTFSKKPEWGNQEGLHFWELGKRKVEEIHTRDGHQVILKSNLSPHGESNSAPPCLTGGGQSFPKKD